MGEHNPELTDLPGLIDENTFHLFGGNSPKSEAMFAAFSLAPHNVSMLSTGKT